MSKARLKRRLKAGPQVSPFLVLGDPTPEISFELARAAGAAGAGMIEIGLPYGDPVADGPAIQAADDRALEGGTSTTKALEILGRIKEALPKTPLNLLVYGNLVHARGLERFCAEVTERGASSLLVPDMCLEESDALRKACKKAKLGHVQLIGPLTSRDRLAKIDRKADSFLYLVAHQGVTGVRESGFDTVEALVARTVAAVKNPICLGFGLSKRDQIDRAFAAGARIAVVGSYLANVIGEAWRDESEGRGERVVTAFTRALEPLTGSRTENSHLPEPGRKL